MSFYLVFSEKNIQSQKKKLDAVMPLIIEEGSLIYNLPKNALVSFVQNGSLSVTESVYGNVGWIFCQHFLKRLGSEYSNLAGIVDMNNLVHVEALTNIKKRLRSDTFTREVKNSY
jgi:glutamate dehydrogenase